MKKQFLMLLLMFVSIATYAQKDELKAAEKAIKSGDYITAKANVDKLESMLGSMDDKTKAQFYYLQASTYGALSKTSSAHYDKAAEAYDNLFAVEKALKSTKYTTLAQPELQALVTDVSTKGIASYQSGNYASAKKELHEVYMLSKKDTVFLEYAANAAYLDKDFDASLAYFTELKNLGYTGITTEYSALNNETKQREVFSSKTEMELMKKTKGYSDFKETTTESKKPNIIKNIAFCHVEKGDTEKAIEAVKDARKMDPKDVGLILTEANLQIKLGNKDAFAKLMNEAIALDPKNHVLYYNLGVISAEQGDIPKAMEYYKQAIALDPNYKDAYVNLGAAMLEKDKELVEEMNKNLNDFKKYDAIKAKQVTLYKEVIPMYEKAYSLDPKDHDTVKTLLSLYENAGMDAEYKKMKEVHDKM
jgi:tetratricopeptide (TPR) repeat protein